MYLFVPDRVASAKSDPLRDRAVLLLGLGQLLLGTERLVALCIEGVGGQLAVLMIDIGIKIPSTRAIFQQTAI